MALSTTQFRNPITLVSGSVRVFITDDQARKCGIIQRSIAAGNTRVFAVDFDSKTLGIVGEFLKKNKGTVLDEVEGIQGLLALFNASLSLEIHDLEKIVRKRCAKVDPTTISKRPPTLLPHPHPSIFIPMGYSGRLCTKTLMSCKFFQSERRLEYASETYRIWISEISKLCESILAGIKCRWMGPGQRVLYLGAGTGRTASYVADVVGPQGHVYALEISRIQDGILSTRAARVSQMTALYGDARYPGTYAGGILTEGQVDVIVSDCDQPDEIDFVAINVRQLLRPGGHFIVFVKDIKPDEKITRMASRVNVKGLKTTTMGKGYLCMTGRKKRA